MPNVPSPLEVLSSFQEHVPVPDRLHVLLIEDNPEQAALVQLELAADAGRYEYEWLPNLVAGMQRLSQGGIDVVLLDLGMPELSGSKTFTAVQTMAPNTPILVFTADAQIDTRRSTLASGAADYLIKDQMGPGDLSEAIRAAIGRFRNRGRAIPEPAPGSGPGAVTAG